MKILIALATYNRKFITERCIQNLIQFKKEHHLHITDDMSIQYSVYDFFKPEDNVSVTQYGYRMNIHALRYQQLLDFVNHRNEDLIYFTDNDAIHDPHFIDRLLYLYNYTDKKQVVTLYNTKHHDFMPNTIAKNDNVTIRKTAPGISHLYDRKMATEILKNPLSQTISWDYDWPNRLLNAKMIDYCLTSSTSYVEHIGAFGTHSPGADMNRDRAINPTTFLKQEREKIIKEYAEFFKTIKTI